VSKNEYATHLEVNAGHPSNSGFTAWKNWTIKVPGVSQRVNQIIMMYHRLEGPARIRFNPYVAFGMHEQPVFGMHEQPVEWYHMGKRTYRRRAL
jgi:hypothetical protein